MVKYLRIAGAVILALTIILSCTVVGTKLTDPATYSHIIEVLDDNRTTVLKLTAASATASALISALPDDICAPLAQEISELTTYFMLILSVLYLEKYLLTILGAAACYILIPAGCSALLVNCFFPKATLQSIGIKLAVFGVASLLVIPSSVWVSDQINAIYYESIEMSIESATAASENLIGDVADDGEEGTGVIDEATALLGNLSGSVAGVVTQFKNLLNRFIESTAVMIVTTCLIPVLVIILYVWLVKTLFNIHVILPTSLPKPKRLRGSHKEKDDLALTE